MSGAETMASFVVTLKRVAAILRDEEIPFALGGGLAAWARGGPETDHDVDFFVKPEDALRAQEALVEHGGMQPERPPEDWLLKVLDGDVLVDLVFRPSGGPVTDAWLERADERELMAMTLPILSLEDVMSTKLLALREQEPDFGQVLRIARALREQIPWERVRRADGALAVGARVLHARGGAGDRGIRGGTHGSPTSPLLHLSGVEDVGVASRADEPPSGRGASAHSRTLRAWSVWPARAHLAVRALRPGTCSQRTWRVVTGGMRCAPGRGTRRSRPSDRSGTRVESD